MFQQCFSKCWSKNLQWCFRYICGIKLTFCKIFQKHEILSRTSVTHYGIRPITCQKIFQQYLKIDMSYTLVAKSKAFLTENYVAPLKIPFEKNSLNWELSIKRGWPKGFLQYERYQRVLTKDWKACIFSDGQPHSKPFEGKAKRVLLKWKSRSKLYMTAVSYGYWGLL